MKLGDIQKVKDNDGMVKGLVIEENSTMYLPGSVKFLGYNYWGIASR